MSVIVNSSIFGISYPDIMSTSAKAYTKFEEGNLHQDFHPINHTPSTRSSTTVSTGQIISGAKFFRVKWSGERLIYPLAKRCA